ncbi:MAG: amidase [Actinomycetota bacterium]
MAPPIATRPDLPDATELLRQVHEGERTAEDLVREHLDRLDLEHPRINAATTVFREKALEGVKKPRAGPLSGLPMSVKETFAIAGEEITAGSIRMPPIPCEEDAVVVSRLRKAGAIILARSNVPEFAMNPETSNLRYGRSNNPLDPSRTSGGSSGGEGALVASGSTAAGVGSDILGSIRFPAAFCGVVGFKPSSEAVDGAGIWPEVDGYMASWFGAGPIARSVRDARLIYDVIAREPTATKRLPVGLRLVVPRRFRMKVDPAIRRALDRGRVVLEAAGMVTEEQPFPDVGRLFLGVGPLLRNDFLPMMRRDLTTDEGKRFSLAIEAIARLFRQPTVDPLLFRLLVVASLLPPSKGLVRRATSAFERARAHYRDLLGEDGILLLPAVGTFPPKHGRLNRKCYRPGVVGVITAATFCNYVDLSAISVPAWAEADPRTGFPPGVMLACAPGQESRLLDAAAALEEGISA